MLTLIAMLLAGGDPQRLEIEGVISQDGEVVSAPIILVDADKDASMEIALDDGSLLRIAIDNEIEADGRICTGFTVERGIGDEWTILATPQIRIVNGGHGSIRVTNRDREIEFRVKTANDAGSPD